MLCGLSLLVCIVCLGSCGLAGSSLESPVSGSVGLDKKVSSNGGDAHAFVCSRHSWNAGGSRKVVLSWRLNGGLGHQLPHKCMKNIRGSCGDSEHYKCLARVMLRCNNCTM